MRAVLRPKAENPLKKRKELAVEPSAPLHRRSPIEFLHFFREPTNPDFSAHKAWTGVQNSAL
jgi:hypothetical protein